MTTSRLLACIVAALRPQWAVGAGLAWWRRRAATGGAPPVAGPPPAALAGVHSAWSGGPASMQRNRNARSIANLSGADHTFRRMLAEPAVAHPVFRLHVVCGKPGLNDVQDRDYQHAGRIDVDLLRRNLPHGRHQFFVCGPSPMVQTLVPGLREWGINEDDIHFEAFGPASVQPPARVAPDLTVRAAVSVDVRFQRSGRSIDWDDQDGSLLDFAERHGVPVDPGCRSGSCSACETRLVPGSVLHADKPDHDIARGRGLLCVGKPGSALVLEA